MKILHLADLHLGKILQEQSLIEDQEYMLKEIIKIIKNEDIGAVLISGDVYDRSVPPAEAVNLLDNFLKILIKELKIKVFIISGNHDSKDRLGFGSKIFEDEGLYIESKYNGNLRKIEIEDEYGKLNIYMLPFIKPVEVKQYFEDDLENNYNTAINKDNELFNDILKYDYISLGKTSNLPQFFNKFDVEDFKNRCHVFLQDENNVSKYLPDFYDKPAKHIIKYVHFEPFKFDILELKKDIYKDIDKEDNIIMFVYDDKKIFEKSKSYRVII